jgi:hypothetical protein
MPQKLQRRRLWPACASSRKTLLCLADHSLSIIVIVFAIEAVLIDDGGRDRDGGIFNLDCRGIHD